MLMGMLTDADADDEAGDADYDDRGACSDDGGDDVDDDNHPVGYNDHDFDTAPQISLRRKMYIV